MIFYGILAPFFSSELSKNTLETSVVFEYLHKFTLEELLLKITKWVKPDNDVVIFLKTTLETSGEDRETTLEASVEDIATIVYLHVTPIIQICKMCCEDW